VPDDQQGLFPELTPARNGNGRKGQRLFIPKLLTDASKSTWLNDRIEEAHAIFVKWAELETSGKLARKSEKTLHGEFLADVMNAALGYTQFSDGLETWDLEAEFAVAGGHADAAIGQFAASDRPPPRVLVELKGPQCNIDRDRSSGRTPVQQVWDYLNDVPQCPWGIVSNLVSFRLYHRTKTPRTYEHFTLQELRDKNRFREFYCLFERGGFLPALAGQKPRCDDLLEKSEHQQRKVGGDLYKLYHDQRVSLIHHFRGKPHSLPIDQAIHVAQKLLDRIIFIAFCQSRRLLPSRIIQYAWNASTGFAIVDNPRWQSFKGLFKKVDKGDSKQHINAYNGELFKPNLIDTLELDDSRTDLFKEIADFDFENEVNVEVLGHLFEQSITDLEVLRENPDADAPIPRKKPGRRKREGVYYTPPFITAYIVRQAIGPCLQERYTALAAELKLDLATPPPGRTGKRWATYFEGQYAILRGLRVCDPACGSGAFLIEAFNYLEGQYEAVIDDLIAEGQCTEAELDKINPTILQENLFGVDLSQEAVEITKLALWIRTAELGKPLSNLSGNIQWGNSVVADASVDPKALDWQATFRPIFAAGGFDVVIGNPPYVRQELLAPIKPHLEEHFRAFHGMADLYVYFYELGLRLLKPGGRLSYVVTNKWMKAGYGEPLRQLFADAAWVESVVDFGHAKQIFEDADVFPSIIVARKPSAAPKPTTARLCVIPREQLRIDDLSRQIVESGVELPLEQLNAEEWQLEPGGVNQLLEKISRNGTSLTDFAAVEPLSGIKTGLNEAFLIDHASRAALVAANPKSAALLKPYLRGQDFSRWSADWQGMWMIALRSSENYAWPWAEAGESAENVFRREHPAVFGHLNKHREQLVARQDQGRYWWELRSCAYWETFEDPKIMYPEITWRACWCLDSKGTLCNNTAYLIPTDDLWILAVINAPVTWWYAWRKMIHGKDEALRYIKESVRDLPIPKPDKRHRTRAESHVRTLITNTERGHTATKTTLDWLRVEHEIDKPTLKLQAPVDLDSDAFVAEVKRVRGRRKPLSAAGLKSLRDEHARTIEPARTLAAESQALERELSDLVNAAYGLTPEEVALMWATAPPRMPIRSPSETT
jgi:hypothetical protein